MKYEMKKQGNVLVRGILLVLGMWVMLVCAAPVVAEEVIDIYNPGSGGIGWSYLGSEVRITANGEYTVSGSTNVNRIVVGAGVTATLTLRGVVIRSASGGSPLALESGANVTLLLVGANELTATNTGTANPAAGLQVEEPSQLIIEEAAAGASLMATGAGYTPYKSAATDAYGGAGIGGGKAYGRAGTIIIRSGAITATGGENAAGIGGSGYSYNIGNNNLDAIYSADVRSFGGYITIEGGTVTARGGEGFGGAAIGGGLFGNADITINGGTVYAYAPDDAHGALSAGTDSWTSNAAAIGSGAFVASSNITINGGEVYAFSYKGAAIGSGGSMYNVAYYPANNGSISIAGGTVVAKSSIGYGDPAAIGGGSFMQAGVINISGGVIYAVGNGSSGGIGSGSMRSDISYGGITATPDRSSLTITNGTIIASMIGRQKGSAMPVYLSSAGDYTVLMSPIINGTLFGNATVIRDVQVTAGSTSVRADAAVVLLSDTTIDGQPLTIPNNARIAVPKDVTFDVNHQTIIVEGELYNTGGRIINDDYVTYKKVLQQNWVQLIPDQTYTGLPLTPTLTLLTGTGVQLMENRDYTVQYERNTDPGYAIVTITGIGTYAGSVLQVNFLIARSSASTPLQDAWIDSIPDQTYTGYNILPKPTIYEGTKLLTENVDYTLEYSNNENVGIANIHITGKGEYTGTIIKPFNILRKLINAAWLTPIPDQYYTGLPIEPVITLHDPDRNTTLIRTQDFSAYCNNNTDVGTATITINGEGNYQGALSANFSIIHKPPHTVIILSMLSDLVKANTALSPDLPYFEVPNDSAFVLKLEITGNNVTILAPPELTVNDEKVDFFQTPDGNMYYSNLITINKDLIIRISGMSILTATAPTPHTGLSATVESGGLRLHGLTPGETLELYDPTGQLLYKTTATATQTLLPLTPTGGTCIIIAGNNTLKVVY